MNHTASVIVLALAVTLDLAVGEWPEQLHPVSWFGRLVELFDRAWRHPNAVGVILAVGLPIVVAIFLGCLTVVTYGMHPVAGVLVAGFILFSTISLRMLLSVARKVKDLTDADLASARTEVRALVGRDPTTLSPSEIRSAVIESLAENLSDGFVAPLVAFTLGAQISLGLAVGAAAWVKAVNTLDSMLGYRSKPLGWASARLDDMVMWVPARLTACLLALSAADLRAVFRARSWAQEPKSPNSGWPMSTVAIALNVELVKPGEYRLNSSGDLPSVEDVDRAVRIVAISGLLATVVAGVVVWV